MKVDVTPTGCQKEEPRVYPKLLGQQKVLQMALSKELEIG